MVDLDADTAAVNSQPCRRTQETRSPGPGHQSCDPSGTEHRAPRRKISFHGQPVTRII